MSRKFKSTGPTATELKMRNDFDRMKREGEKLRKDYDKLRKELERVTNGGAAPAAPAAATTRDQAPLAAAATGGAGVVESRPASPAPDELSPAEIAALRQQVSELSAAKQRLSRLYFSQLEENRKRAHKLHEILENITGINSEFDLDTLLSRLAETLRASLGFRLVLIRIREPGTQLLKARAFAGIDEAGRVRLESEDVLVPDFLSWLKDEFKVSRSYFISHAHAFSRELPQGFAPDLGPREEWEWHCDDVLLVPLFNRTGELLAYFSVDDPADRLVPSRESIELLEIFGNHAVVAIENARLYRQLESHTRELEQAGQHLHEMHQLKSNFVSAVSHELRTPLTAIRAYVDTLMAAREGEITQDQLRHFLSIINEESHRLARLIESVLDLSRFDSGAARPSRQSVDLRELVEETTRLLDPVARVGQVAVQVVQECADTRIDANRDQMRQLVLHLASNAVKFTPPGGAVTVRIQGDDREICLRVEDTGIGIPAQSLERIFERFYQVDSSLVRRYGGTGLGLAICKAIVDWHGGRIYAESQPGEGSRFTVDLPRQKSPRVVVRPSPKPRAAMEDVLRLAIEMVAEVMGARVVSLLAPDSGGDLVIRAAIGLDENVVRDARIRLGQGVAGWVAEHRRPVCVSGDGERSEVEGSGRLLYRSRTFLSVPLESESGLLGVLNVTDPESQKPFDAEDCHLLLHLAERVAAAWEQALGMEQSQTDVEGTARVLGQVLEHLERARRSAPDRVRLARSLARQLELTESEVGVISFAASIHDVGMRQLGEHLEAGGKLSAEERAAVERHPEIAAEMLRPLETVGVVRDVVLAHHEWFDGTGYPRGLAGGEIPVGGRILAVVDAYESMTVGRAHRRALPRSEALAELEKLKGRQFDPAIVDVFERALEDVERQNLGDGAAWTQSTHHPA